MPSGPKEMKRSFFSNLISASELSVDIFVILLLLQFLDQCGIGEI